MKNPYVNIVLQKYVMKMIDTEKILNKIDDNKKFHDKKIFGEAWNFMYHYI